MAFTQLVAPTNHPDGQVAQATRAWPQGARNVDIRFDVWGAGGQADPWTGVSAPFNVAGLVLEGRIIVRYADDRVEEHSRSVWLGRPDGNWGGTKAGSVVTQPQMGISFPTGKELPVEARPGFRVTAGPITFGISVQIQ